MMRLEVLDPENKIISTHALAAGLTLLGKSPGAHVHLSGPDIGALHVAIKGGTRPVIMDLGGPSRLRVDGKETLEHEFDETKPVALLEIGSRRVRLARTLGPATDLRKQDWQPVVDRRASGKARLMIRTRVFTKGVAQEAVNTRGSFELGTHYGLSEPFQAVWIKGKEAYAQLPAEWIRFGGRLQAGARIGKLEELAGATRLEQDVVYRIFAGPYTLEILVKEAAPLVIGSGTIELLPHDLRKPLGVSLAIVAALFGLWALLMARTETKVEEPYPVYARIQNIPVEKLPEPEPNQDLPQAGGGSGSEQKESSAPTQGAAQSAPSKLAASLTGGLKNLVGSVVSSARSSGAIVSETGIGQAAAAGAPGPGVGRISAVGNGANTVAGAAKLGNLGIAGSGKGFSGGSGTGLGTGVGAGIGNGVGNGIGRGGFRLVEEESIVDGGLDKSVIAAVIQNNLAQIKYCYERQLVAEPDLFGKVVVNWVINASGGVEATSVKQTTLNSAPVEQCMLAKISGWKFPQPKNGTKVHVSYPFLFKSTK